MAKALRLDFASSLTKICEGNTSFDHGVLAVAYHGKNRNGSYISKETFEKKISTAFNCPLVCHYMRENDSIGGHDMEVYKDTDNNLHLVNVTEPVGVVPESASYWWEVMTDNGEDHEYLCIEVLLWKRQEAYQKLKEDGITAESMEINVIDGYNDKDSGVYVINDFEFTAFCLQGDDVEPCFEQAALELYSMSELKEQISNMMSELKESFSLISPSTQGVDLNTSNYEEGGNCVLNEKYELMKQYGISAEQLDFSIDEISLEELQVKLDEICRSASGDAENTPASEEPAPAETVAETEAKEDSEAAEEEPHHEGEEKFELNQNIRIEIERALKVEQIHKPWGDEQRYWLEDYDTEKQEIYCHDSQNWLVYKMPYAMRGDLIIIDFLSRKRVKCAYVDFAENEMIPDISIISMFEEKYQKEIESLEKFKTDTEAAAAKAKEDAEHEAVFSIFDAELNGVSAYDELKANCEGVSKEALEEKCYAIRGRYGAKFSLENKAPKLLVENEAGKEYENEPYGGIVLRYGNKNK